LNSAPHQAGASPPASAGAHHPAAPATLYDRLRRDAADDWAAFTEHPFLTALAAGTLPPDEYAAWMVQDYLYLIHYTRAYALLLTKSDTVAEMAAAAAIIHGLLDTEMSLHRHELARLGVDLDSLERTQETLETLAYGRYILDRAHTGDALDLSVTLSACLVGYAEIGRRLLADPATKLDGNPYRGWIETYAGDDYDRIVRRGLDKLEALSLTHGGPARYPALLRQFRQAVRLEAAFWNAGRSALAAAPSSRP
jgi:thiaminase/transcriptional activator TenA